MSLITISLFYECQYCQLCVFRKKTSCNNCCCVTTTGRSARDHTLSINMREMRQMEVNMNDSTSDTNMTITLGTGLGWGELYEEASSRGQPVYEKVLPSTLTDISCQIPKNISYKI